MLRIGRISYANCTPIFSGLHELAPGVDFQLVSGVPSHLNSLLASGEIDVCPSSSFEFACRSEQYLVLPDLSISSIGAVGSVLLFSRLPIEELSGHPVLLSSESATSVNLLRVLLSLRYGVACEFHTSRQPLHRALKEAPAMLLIGDAALKAALETRDLLVYDLGDLWYRWTSLPFVFALWLCNRRVAAERPVEISRLVRLLLAAKKYAVTALTVIAKDAPEAAWMGRDRLVAYWRDNISYDLGRSHLEGLSLFFRYCAELDLVGHEPKLEFLEAEPDREG